MSFFCRSHISVWSEFVLCFGKVIGIGTEWKIEGLLGNGGCVVLAVVEDEAVAAVDISGYIPCLLIGENSGLVRHRVWHVVLNKSCKLGEAVERGYSVETMAAPQGRVII